nr:ChaN family lipoprotein [Quisquiliibacterium transsilvanicum]
MGEIHDHPMHHRLRARWLGELSGQGRFVLAIEQLDADRQPALDEARREAQRTQEAAGGAAGSATDRVPVVAQSADPALRIAQAAGFDSRGWHWPFYAPYVELALRRGLPLVAANLSNEQARRIARGEPHPLAGVLPPGWGATERAAMAAEIRDGHCGMLPESAIVPMAAAQVARDAQMARALVEAHRASGLPVVLLAGNGHVRADLGVPRHLAGLMPGARVLSVGFVEPGGPLPAFDLAVLTPVHPRPDPCEAMRRSMR